MKISIDIVIPSFRLEEKYILPILKLQKPADVELRTYLIADNPSIYIPPPLMKLVDDQNIFLTVNPKNLGASAARNKGIDAGKGDWILFLDDDIAVEENLLFVYANAIRSHPDEIGFIGLVNLPSASTAFNKAIVASGYMNIFSIALQQQSHAWGATANIMVRRNAVGALRFSSSYPRSGGGEDVDFFLRVGEKNNAKKYFTIREAVVHHPWWAKTGTDFRRIFRYGQASSILEKENLKYTYRDFLNTPEMALLLILLTLAFAFVKTSCLIPTFAILGGILVIEWFALHVHTLKRSPGHSFKTFLYIILIKFIHESGVLWGKLKRMNLWMIGLRFHIDGTVNKMFFLRTNTYRIIKWILYPILIFTAIKFL